MIEINWIQIIGLERTGGTLLARRLDSDPNNTNIYSLKNEYWFSKKLTPKNNNFHTHTKIALDECFNYYKTKNVHTIINHLGRSINADWRKFLSTINHVIIITIREPNGFLNSAYKLSGCNKKYIDVLKYSYELASKITYFYKYNYCNTFILDIKDIVNRTKHFYDIMNVLKFEDFNFTPTLYHNRWNGPSMNKILSKPKIVTYKNYLSNNNLNNLYSELYKLRKSFDVDLELINFDNKIKKEIDNLFFLHLNKRFLYKDIDLIKYLKDKTQGLIGLNKSILYKLIK